jgi:hypothetical protein
MCAKKASEAKTCVCEEILENKALETKTYTLRRPQRQRYPHQEGPKDKNLHAKKAPKIKTCASRRYQRRRPQR